VPPAADVTSPLDGAVRGVAGDGATVFALADVGGMPVVTALRDQTTRWRTQLTGTAAPALARAGGLVAAIVSARPMSRASNGAATSGDAGVRGDPASIVVALDAATGARKWTLLFDSTDYAVITSIAPLGDDFIVGGLFGGTLRANQRVVTSAGSSDGFVARISTAGDVAWLVRSGGTGADGIQGVATRDRRIAIAGTFTTGAELAGHTLAGHDERSPYADAFAAELDERGTRLWSATFGGRTDDAVAGVTIDARGHVVVAANAREVIHVGSTQLVAQGEGDGVLVWLGDHGEHLTSILVGGLDFDGLRAITSIGDKTIVGGFFSGKLQLGDRTLTAGGGDDSFIAAFDPNGTLATSWHVGGDGREEITSLSAIPGGFVAGVAFTASAQIDGAKLPAPKDPMTGSAIVVRGVP
jgi:hypothetical protein